MDSWKGFVFYTTAQHLHTILCIIYMYHQQLLEGLSGEVLKCKDISDEEVQRIFSFCGGGGGGGYSVLIGGHFSQVFWGLVVF